MSTDTEQRLGLLLQQAVIEPPREITVESVRRRAGKQRQSIAGLSIATVAAVAAAIVVPIALVGHSGHSRTAVEAGLPTLVLGSLASGRLVLENPTDPKSARTVSGPLDGDLDRFIADNSRTGWVANVSPPVGQIGPYLMQIATVSRTGKITTFGPAFRQTNITGLALSPNGGELALATVRQHANTKQAVIRVMPMPGFAGQRRSWILDPKQANQVQSLSWSPDGHELSYIAGTSAGNGISGAPTMLKVTRPGRSAPAVSRWQDPNRTKGGAGLVPHCVPDAAGWIGSNGDFGVVADCHHGGEIFMRVNPANGVATGRGIRLPGRNCLGTRLHSSAGGAVLVSWCHKAYFLHGGEFTQLPGGLTDAAFPGQVPTS